MSDDDRGPRFIRAERLDDVRPRDIIYVRDEPSRAIAEALLERDRLKAELGEARALLSDYNAERGGERLKRDLMKAVVKGCDYCGCTDFVLEALAKHGMPATESEQAEMDEAVRRGKELP